MTDPGVRISPPEGYLLYRGASLLPPFDPIIVILTLGSSNTKTGAMSQTWILREDLHPLDSVRQGQDASICGDCVHRGGTEAAPRRSCYVQVAFGPANIWRSYKRGIYPHAPPTIWAAALRGHAVRLGAYGDPLAAPLSLWQLVVSAASGHTGYTHAWQLERAEPYRAILMASVDTPGEAKRAHTQGWRTFRVRGAGASHALMPFEITCPASEEAGKRTTCARCLLCDGKRPPAHDAGAQDPRKHIAIEPHGQWAVNFHRNRQQLLLIS